MRDNHQAAAVSDSAYCLLTKASETTTAPVTRHADESHTPATGTDLEVE